MSHIFSIGCLLLLNIIAVKATVFVAIIEFSRPIFLTFMPNRKNFTFMPNQKIFTGMYYFKCCDNCNDD